MKKTNIVLSVIMLAYSLMSCTKQHTSSYPDTNSGSLKEVDIEIYTPDQGGATRAQVFGTDAGIENERLITVMDVLVFRSDNNEYLYRRPASKMTASNTYRVSLVEPPVESTNPTVYAYELTFHLLANSRQILEAWDPANDKSENDHLKWEDINAELVDDNPARLVATAAEFKPLPMWGKSGSLSINPLKAPQVLDNKVQMLRSVASIDLYVQDTERTENFELKRVYAYYAPNKGYPGAVVRTPTTDPVQYISPADMTTSLAPYANHVQQTSIGDRDYMAIAYQLYLYDNPYVETGNDNKRPTRIVMGGEYKGQPAYYAIDMVDADRYYFPMIRNWKFEYRVFAVNGPGSPTLEEAAVSSNTDLEIQFVDWNTVGIEGQYRMNMERRTAMMEHTANFRRTLTLTYQILDNYPNDQFTIRFRDPSAANPNGEQAAIINGIENDFFRVEMTRTGTDEGIVTFVITALQEYTPGNDTEYFEILFRGDLIYYVTIIVQEDKSDEDWIDGGVKEQGLG